jgi:hypothetical protein
MAITQQPNQPPGVFHFPTRRHVFVAAILLISARTRPEDVLPAPPPSSLRQSGRRFPTWRKGFPRIDELFCQTALGYIHRWRSTRDHLHVLRIRSDGPAFRLRPSCTQGTCTECKPVPEWKGMVLRVSTFLGTRHLIIYLGRRKSEFSTTGHQFSQMIFSKLLLRSPHLRSAFSHAMPRVGLPTSSTQDD